MHSARNYLIAGLALTTALVSGLAWRQHMELVQLRAAALDPRERADWQQRLWAAEKRRGELEQQAAAATAAPADEPLEATAPAEEFPGVAGTRVAGRGAGQNRFAAMMERPDIQRLLALQHKSALDNRYADLFKRLALTPAQLDQFKNLLVEKTTSTMDVMAAAREQGVNPRSDRDAFRKLVAEAEGDIDASIRALLGEPAFAEFKSYEQTAPQRAVVNQLEQRLSYSGTPLTSEQSARLVQILASTQPAGAGSGGSTGRLPGPAAAAAATFLGRGQTSITETAINQSLGVLAAPQLEALRELQQEQQAQAELAAAFRSQRQSGRDSPPPASATRAAIPVSPAPRAGG